MFQHTATRVLLLSAITIGACFAPDEAPETSEVAASVALPPGLNFELPFLAGTVWNGSTYAGHNGGNPGGFFSIDWINTQGSSFGQTVLPSAPGTVIPVNPDPNGYGNFVDVSHGSGWTTRYAHLSAVFVHPGDVVDAGHALGLTGATGATTGPHLHYEQRFNGVIQPSVFEGQPFNYAGQTLTSHNGAQNCTTSETAGAAQFGCQCVDHQPNGGFCPGTGCTAGETAGAAQFGCQCVDHQPNGGFCPGAGCTAGEAFGAAAFGCQCVDHQPNGGFCPGAGCTALEQQNAAAFGCQCVDHQPSGGFCAGGGCTALEQRNAAAFGCQCVDHQPSGGFCAGTGCTGAETLAAQALGCVCVDHKPAGGSCGGSGCTAAETLAASAVGCGCANHRPSGGFCPIR